MRQTLSLIAAPTGMQPGNYVKAAYADASTPATPSLDINVMASGGSWEIHTRWACAQPNSTVSGYTDRFADALAILVPCAQEANWITMGSPEAPVEGILWRADRDGLIRIGAQGLGSVQRQPSPAGWRVKSEYSKGVYTLMWLFPKWENLERFKRCGFAVWQGAQHQRAGLKSVSAGWVDLHG